MVTYTVRYEPKKQRTNTTAIIAIIVLLVALAWPRLPGVESSIAVNNNGSYVTSKGMHIPVVTLVLPDLSYQETCTKHGAVYLPHSSECYISW